MAKEALYDALTLSEDAQRFARSRFGRHYIKRLKKLRESHLDAAMSMEYTDSFRANSASKAAAIGAEIEFFKIAQTIQSTPSLRQKLVEKMKKGGKSNKTV